LLLVPLVLLLPLLVPVVHPVALRAGGWWLVVSTGSLLPGARASQQGFDHFDVGPSHPTLLGMPSRVSDLRGEEWAPEKELHARWLVCGRWLYAVVWFRGRRLK
jgi:hypothetical protein